MKEKKAVTQDDIYNNSYYVVLSNSKIANLLMLDIFRLTASMYLLFAGNHPLAGLTMLGLLVVMLHYSNLVHDVIMKNIHDKEFKHWFPFQSACYVFDIFLVVFLIASTL